MNILRFQTNVPTEVTLSSPQGTLVPGRYSDRMLFHLADGRVMYVPPIVAHKIEAQQIRPGECFALCKTVVRTGQRRGIEWSVQKLLDPETPQCPIDSTAQPQSLLERDLRRSIELVKASKTAGDRQPPSDAILSFAPTPEREADFPVPHQNGKNQSVPIRKLTTTPEREADASPNHENGKNQSVPITKLAPTPEREADAPTAHQNGNNHTVPITKPAPTPEREADDSPTHQNGKPQSVPPPSLSTPSRPPSPPPTTPRNSAPNWATLYVLTPTPSSPWRLRC